GWSYSAVPVFNGPGIIQLVGGGIQLVDNLIANLQLISGSISLGSNFQGGSITNLTLGPSMTLYGDNTVSGRFDCSGYVPGNLTVTGGGVLDWSGTARVDGTLTVARGAELNISGDGQKSFYGPLNNSGTVTWSGNGNIYVVNDGNRLGAINNLAGGLFDIQN